MKAASSPSNGDRDTWLGIGEAVSAVTNDRFQIMVINEVQRIQSVLALLDRPNGGATAPIGS